MRRILKWCLLAGVLLFVLHSCFGVKVWGAPPEIGFEIMEPLELNEIADGLNRFGQEIRLESGRRHIADGAIFVKGQDKTGAKSIWVIYEKNGFKKIDQHKIREK